jgi:acetyl coenzyme A synthetase (ADP forming)-like protein
MMRIQDRPINTTDFLDPFFKPRSIAVIGATPRKGTIGYQILSNIVNYGFNGMVFPVNPKHNYIKSIKCHPSVLDIPDPVDLAVVVVPKEHVLAVAEECGKKGVKGLIIISAGFREIGGEGIAREEALTALTERYGFRIIGPNCMGVISANPAVRMNATFAPHEPDSGSLAIMTQSGALGVAILLSVHKLHLGLSSFVSVGNKVDVSGNDLLEYWAADENTKVIALYLESFGEPRRFTQLSKKITKQKPIILVKSGTTPAGALAASSHTGHLAGLDIAVHALLQQCGVIRVPTIEEMMDRALAFLKVPLPKGDRIAVLSNAGGPGIMATDAIINEGLSISALSDETKERLSQMLPEESSLRNPVDMIASANAESYEKAMGCMLEDPSVDALIVIFVPPIMIEPREAVERITATAQTFDKPVFMVLMAEEHYYEELPRSMPDAPPLYRFPESAVRALADMNRHRIWCDKPEGGVRRFPVKYPVHDIIDKQQEAGGGYLMPDAVNRILESYGFPVCRAELVSLDEDLTAAAGKVQYPVALKVFGRSIIHKSDFGGVVLDIKDEQMLEKSRAEMKREVEEAGLADEVDGLIIQEMAEEGKEVILGMTIDPKFGPILMFGMGGKYVEITKDITFRVMPVTDVDAREMVKEIKSYPLLEGVRGEEGVDIDFVVESIQRLAQLVDNLPGIVELDLNPVIVTPSRATCRVVDARIRVRS